MPPSKSRLAFIAGCAAAALGTSGVLAVAGGAQQPPGHVIRLVDKNCHFKFSDSPPLQHGRNFLPGAGDGGAALCPLFNAAGTRAGNFDVACHYTKGGKQSRSVCTGAYRLTDGQIHFLAVQLGPEDTTGSVVGGTGAYAGARGTFTSVDRPGENGGDPGDDTITLLP